MEDREAEKSLKMLSIKSVLAINSYSHEQVVCEKPGMKSIDVNGCVSCLWDEMKDVEVKKLQRYGISCGESSRKQQKLWNSGKHSVE